MYTENEEYNLLDFKTKRAISYRLEHIGHKIKCTHCDNILLEYSDLFYYHMLFKHFILIPICKTRDNKRLENNTIQGFKVRPIIQRERRLTRMIRRNRLCLVWKYKLIKWFKLIESYNDQVFNM